MNKFLIAATCVGGLAVTFVTMQNFGERHTFTFYNPTSLSEPQIQPTSAPANEFAAEDWPQWRGVNRDGKSPATDLLEMWPENGPTLLWSSKGLGKGMSTVSVARDQLFTLGEIDGQVQLIARRADSGEPLWATQFDTDGEPTGTPCVYDDYVYAVSYKGKLVCAERGTGNVVWTKDFVADFGGKVPTWGYCESPLIDGRMLICTPGAEDALVVALDRMTGKTAWKCPTPPEMKGQGHDGAGYSSVVVSHGAGVRHYVQLVGQGVIGISPADGSSLWGYTRIANGVASIPTPIVHGDYVFASSGYGAGAALLQLSKTKAGIEAREIYFLAGNKLQNHHGGMILVDDHIYLGHGQNNGLPACIEMVTGKIKWGPVRGPGAESAAITYADGHLYFRYQNGVMALIEATPDAYKLKASFKLPSHLGNSWPHPVIAHGRLYLRDQDVLLCYDLRHR